MTDSNDRTALSFLQSIVRARAFRLLSLAVGLQMLLIWGLRSLGRMLVLLLTHQSLLGLAWPIIQFAAAFLALAFAHAWGQGLPRVRLWGAAVIVLMLGYGLSLVTQQPIGSFHGLVVPEQGSETVERNPALPRITYRHNNLGFRGPHWPTEKKRTTIRIGVVGDSFVYGSGVQESDTLSERTAAILARRAPEQPFEVLNLGIPGNNLESHIDLLDLAITQLQSDMVVLCLLEGNDSNRWDIQDQFRQARRIGTFSLFSYVFGPLAAAHVWGRCLVQDEWTAEKAHFTHAQFDRLRRICKQHGELPLVVYVYSKRASRLEPLLSGFSRAALVTAGETTPNDYFPADGHPTPAGNAHHAARLAGEVLRILHMGDNSKPQPPP